jgi:hypothetical protein
MIIKNHIFNLDKKLLKKITQQLKKKKKLNYK